MKISELVQQLQYLQDQFGDLRVMTQDEQSFAPMNVVRAEQRFYDAAKDDLTLPGLRAECVALLFSKFVK